MVPMVPFLLALVKLGSNSNYFKTWFSELSTYLVQLMRQSVLVYITLVLILITVCSIVKTVEFSLLTSADVHLKLFLLAWTGSVIVIGFKKPIITAK